MSGRPDRSLATCATFTWQASARSSASSSCTPEPAESASSLPGWRSRWPRRGGCGSTMRPVCSRIAGSDGRARGYTRGRPSIVARPPCPSYALNFYNPAVGDQLRPPQDGYDPARGTSLRSMKDIVTVLCGARYGQRERVFDAVIDKVEVKQLSDLSPREIEHDNPEIRRRRAGAVPRPALQPRRHGGRHRHGSASRRSVSAHHCRAGTTVPACECSSRRARPDGRPPTLLALDREGGGDRRPARGAAVTELASALRAVPR